MGSSKYQIKVQMYIKKQLKDNQKKFKKNNGILDIDKLS